MDFMVVELRHRPSCTVLNMWFRGTVFSIPSKLGVGASLAGVDCNVVWCIGARSDYR